MHVTQKLSLSFRNTMDYHLLEVQMIMKTTLIIILELRWLSGKVFIINSVQRIVGVRFKSLLDHGKCHFSLDVAPGLDCHDVTVAADS